MFFADANVKKKKSAQTKKQTNKQLNKQTKERRT
jgi:hypothetical protein